MNKEENLYDILNSIQTCNTISELANKLFLSQPYISRIIKDAEKKYDVILIYRKERPIKLTQAGELVLNNLRKIIETRNELKYNLLPYKKTVEHQVKIALNQPWLEISADKLLEYLLKEFPNITFSFYERTTNLAQKDLLDHNIDIFIGKFLTNKDISSIYVTQSQLYIVASESSSIYNLQSAELKREHLKELDSLPYISLTDDSFFQAMIDNLFLEHEVNLNKKIKVQNSIAAVKLAVKGYGFAISLKDTALEIAAKENKLIKLIHIPDNLLQLSIGISYLNNSHKLIKNITQSITNYFKENSFFN